MKASKPIPIPSMSLKIKHQKQFSSVKKRKLLLIKIIITKQYLPHQPSGTEEI